MGDTHSHVTKAQPRALSPFDTVKGMMASDEYMKQIINYYRGDRDEAMAFLTSSVEYIRKVPKLLECDRTSLLSALMISAQLRLMPSGVMGESYIIPYAREAKFQLGYQGLISLIWRTGQVKSIKAIIVYEGEYFRYEEGLDTILEHTPTALGENAKKGAPIGVYAVAEMVNGGRVFKVMSEEQVMDIKNMSKAKDKPDSPWNSKDPEMWMWRKTCLIQLAKLLPKSKDIRYAVERDYEGEGIGKPALDVGGIAVPRVSHNPADAPEKEAEVPQDIEYNCLGVSGEGCPHGTGAIDKETYDASIKKYEQPLCKKCQKNA